MVYVHPEIKPATPRVLPVWLFRMWSFLIVIPFVFAGIGALWGQRRLGLQMSVGLHRLIFSLMTRYCTENQHTVVPMIFPGELIPWPVDIGMTDVVLALNAMGVATSNCCEGHAIAACMGDCAYIAIKEGFEFPADMLAALDAAGVRYCLTGGKSESPALYPWIPADNESFRLALQAWGLESRCAQFYQ